VTILDRTRFNELFYAPRIEKEFYSNFMMGDLAHLPGFHVYLRLMIVGVSSKAFSAVTPQQRPVEL
jgi:hypothetical protein